MTDVIARPAAGRPAPTCRAQIIVERQREVTLAAFRIVVAFLFVCHGAQKLFGAFGKAPIPVGVWPSWWAGVIEFAAGGLVLLGLFTRPAAVLCSGAMAYAYFTVHQETGLLPIQNHGEPAALYAWIFLLIAILGPGALAIDVLRRQRAQATRR
jgi:putative oxidoreductase